jgi:hypothetical protein
MGVLFKDFWGGESIDFFEFTALFSNDAIVIGERSYRYAEITTQFLDYDPAEYKKAMSALKAAHGNGDVEGYYEAAKEIHALILAMPLYRDFVSKATDLAAREVKPIIAHGLSFDDSEYRHYDNYLELEDAFDNLFPRYRWFLKEMMHRDFNKRGNNRYAHQIEENGMSAFASGISLGASVDVDPAQTTVKYEVSASSETGEPQIFEKMNFTRLADFIYTDFFKALMRENIPKQCKLCGRYFLQERGVIYEYCDNAQTDGKICREIGALASFREKVKSNEVWKIHQRAYKKYYARVLKGKMSKAEFNVWTQRAEEIRDEVLVEYEAALRQGQEFSLDEYAARLNDL